MDKVIELLKADAEKYEELRSTAEFDLEDDDLTTKFYEVRAAIEDVIEIVEQRGRVIPALLKGLGGGN